LFSALVLHPGLKLDYFRVQEWEDEWVDVAENLVREEYIDVYENHVTGDEKTISDDKVRLLVFFCPHCGINIMSPHRVATTDSAISATSPLARRPRNEVKSTRTLHSQSRT
jgi:hypothetical protein